MKNYTHICFGIIPLMTIISCQNSINKVENQKSPERMNEISLDDVKVTADFINSGTYRKGGPGDKYVNVHNLVVDVKNISTDTIFVAAWSCSKEAQFTIDDTSNYSIHSYMMCYSNFPTFEIIPPDSSYIVPIMVSYNPTSGKSPFRIGFIHSRTNQLSSEIKMIELGVNWSDQIISK